MEYREETVFCVKWYELEKAVQDEFGHVFEFVATEEARNDNVYRYRVGGEVNEWEKREVDKFVATGDLDLYMTRALLNTMCARKVIPAGTYLVEVCW